MMTVRAGTRGPSSISTAYGFRSHASCVAPLAIEHLRAELLRLRVRARRQVLPGDAGRKAEVVLDLRARAGLSPRRVRLQHQHVEAFRRAVHGRRETRGSGADDDHVADLCRVDRLVEAEAVGDLLIGRVPEHHLAATDQHGHVRDGDVEPIQQLLDAGIAVEVDVRVRVAVARQELLDAERARGMARPDEHDVAESRARSAPPGAG